MCNSKSVNQGTERKNFNVGILNIDDESSSNGLSGWQKVEYATFFIILLLGLRLLARCFHVCCQKFGERQQRMFTEVVQNNQSGMEMNMMGNSRQGGGMERVVMGEQPNFHGPVPPPTAPPPTYCAAAGQKKQQQYLDYDTVRV